MESGSQVNKYLSWVDWTKVIGIYLVVVGHGIISIDDRFMIWIYSFHMPMFFIISGILAKKKYIQETVSDIFKRLIIPYFLINLICFVFESIRQWYSGTFSINFITNSLCAILFGINSYSLDIRPVCHYTWFLGALAIIKLICSISTKKYYYCILMIVCPILSMVLSRMNIDTYCPLDSAILSTPFYAVGLLLKERLDKLMKKKWSLEQLLVMLTFFVVGGLLGFFNGRHDINSMLFGRNIILFYLSGIMSSISMVVFCSYLPSPSRMTQTIAQGSVVIMGLEHIVFYYTLLRCGLWLFPSAGEHPYLTTLILGCFTLLLFYPIIKFCTKYFPPILGYRKAHVKER